MLLLLLLNVNWCWLIRSMTLPVSWCKPNIRRMELRLRLVRCFSAVTAAMAKVIAEHLVVPLCRMVRDAVKGVDHFTVRITIVGMVTGAGIARVGARQPPRRVQGLLRGLHSLLQVSRGYLAPTPGATLDIR
jgi:hypothetical protein